MVDKYHFLGQSACCSSGKANGNILNINVTKHGELESDLTSAHLPESHTWKKGDHTSSVRVYLSAYRPKGFFYLKLRRDNGIGVQSIQRTA